MSALSDSNMPGRVDPVYIDGASGKIFLTSFRPGPESLSDHAVLCLPPFAEEMNKSRRMLALQGRALAEKNVLFVLPDLYGTGDSEGDFGKTRWDIWCQDIRLITDWIYEQGIKSIDILALRSGIFLGAAFLRSSVRRPRRVVLWSPVSSGSKMLNQLMRTKLVKSGGGSEKLSAKDRWQLLFESGGMELAGYWLSAEMCQCIEQLRLSDMRFGHNTRVQWIDISSRSKTQIPNKVTEMLSLWEINHTNFFYSSVVGPPFWMGPEIETLPELLVRTTDFLTLD